MDPKNLTDEVLLKETERLAKQEREILVSVLHHLREVGRRRLFCTLGFGSLYSYCVEHLGYTVTTRLIAEYQRRASWVICRR